MCSAWSGSAIRPAAAVGTCCWNLLTLNFSTQIQHLQRLLSNCSTEASAFWIGEETIYAQLQVSRALTWLLRVQPSNTPIQCRSYCNPYLIRHHSYRHRYRDGEEDVGHWDCQEGG